MNRGMIQGPTWRDKSDRRGEHNDRILKEGKEDLPTNGAKCLAHQLSAQAYSDGWPND